MAGKHVAANQQREAEQNAQIQELQAQQAAAPQYAAPPPPAAAPAPPPAAGGDDLVSKINQLKQLHDQGVLDDAEFNAAKQKLLGQ